MLLNRLFIFTILLYITRFLACCYIWWNIHLMSRIDVYWKALKLVYNLLLLCVRLLILFFHLFMYNNNNIMLTYVCYVHTQNKKNEGVRLRTQTLWMVKYDSIMTKWLLLTWFMICHDVPCFDADAVLCTK